MVIEVSNGQGDFLTLELVTEIASNETAFLELDTPNPNPFGNQARISGRMPGAGDVLLYIYDTRGRVTALKKTFSGDGEFQFTVDAGDTPSPGKYFFSIRTEYGNENGVLIRQ